MPSAGEKERTLAWATKKIKELKAKGDEEGAQRVHDWALPRISGSNDRKQRLATALEGEAATQRRKVLQEETETKLENAIITTLRRRKDPLARPDLEQELGIGEGDFKDVSGFRLTQALERMKDAGIIREPERGQWASLKPAVRRKAEPGISQRAAEARFQAKAKRPKVDIGRRAKTVAPAKAETEKDLRLQRRWFRNPSRLDFEGIDTPSRRTRNPRNPMGKNGGM